MHLFMSAKIVNQPRKSKREKPVSKRNKLRRDTNDAANSKRYELIMEGEIDDRHRAAGVADLYGIIARHPFPHGMIEPVVVSRSGRKSGDRFVLVNVSIVGGDLELLRKFYGVVRAVAELQKAEQPPFFFIDPKNRIPEAAVWEFWNLGGFPILQISEGLAESDLH